METNQSKPVDFDPETFRSLDLPEWIKPETGKPFEKYEIALTRPTLKIAEALGARGNGLAVITSLRVKWKYAKDLAKKRKLPEPEPFTFGRSDVPGVYKSALVNILVRLTETGWIHAVRKQGNMKWRVRVLREF